MSEKFDVIVVGSGPSGNSAAYTAAKAGLNVLQIERGESPGSKNVQGAILYSDALERIIPDFREDAPLERHLIEQRMWMLDEDSYVGSNYRSQSFNTPPYNRYTIIRAQFDRWFSSKVQEAGALVICETTVTGLHLDGDRVVGVQTDRIGGSVYADAVILADGVNSLLAKKAGFHAEIKARDVALAVKEIHFLPDTTIESRFNVGPDEGVAIEMAGKITQGMVGTGFLYTNKESLTLGVGCLLSDLRTRGISPHCADRAHEGPPGHPPADRGRRDEGIQRASDPGRRVQRHSEDPRRGLDDGRRRGHVREQRAPRRIESGDDHRAAGRRNPDRAAARRQELLRRESCALSQPNWTTAS